MFFIKNFWQKKIKWMRIFDKKKWINKNFWKIRDAQLVRLFLNETINYLQIFAEISECILYSSTK